MSISGTYLCNIYLLDSTSISNCYNLSLMDLTYVRETSNLLTTYFAKLLAIYLMSTTCVKGSLSVAVSTQDSESCNTSSNLVGSYAFAQFTLRSRQQFLLTQQFYYKLVISKEE